MLQLPLDIVLDDSAKFDNFFSSNKNQQLLSRLKTIRDSKERFVFVWGSAETGKTHLAQSLCHQFDRSDFSVAYIPLANPLIRPEILKGIGTMDLICLDDIDTIVTQPDWQEALFDLYNLVKQFEHRLVIFSHQPPSELAFDLADLKSRLMAMEIYKIHSLDDQQKQRLLQQRAQNRGLFINDDVAKFILSRQSRSLTDLVESIEKMDEISIARQRKVTIPFVKEIFNW